MDNTNSIGKEDNKTTEPGAGQEEDTDILVLDDVFPHPLSAFRMQEFMSYLQECENLKIYSSGLSVGILGGESLDELLADFGKKHPEYKDKVGMLQAGTVIHAKLIYTVFLWTAYQYIDMIEKAGAPLVFTLYPGGRFGINNPESDRMLKRVTSSPCFRRVIVTQKVTYDYLLQKNFCTPQQIEFIFGVVTPLEYIEKEYRGKRHFGTEKSTLDICFAAYKYTPKGIDKGYDVFVQVARELCKSHDNIHFHVVGGFDENVMDVSDIGNRITFYGKRNMEWFDGFYRDKDIILSPNIPFMLFEGSFDGFPLGTSVDAGLRKTALFCTDELGLNAYFIDGEEIVIVPHDARQIAGIIDHYYKNPEKLKAIAEKGYWKIRELYSFEAQMLPRLRVLREELELAQAVRKLVFETQIAGTKPIFRQRLEQGLISSIRAAKRASPGWVKAMVKRVNRWLRSNKALFGFIKRYSPEFVVKLYLKLFGN
jgi:glycosyltransferase involved in cell wall biosynthesis